MKMSNLLKLLQPVTYKSKLKLYCKDSKLEVIKFTELENKSYISQITITKKI